MGFRCQKPNFPPHIFNTPFYYFPEALIFTVRIEVQYVNFTQVNCCPKHIIFQLCVSIPPQCRINGSMTSARFHVSAGTLPSHDTMCLSTHRLHSAWNLQPGKIPPLESLPITLVEHWIRWSANQHGDFDSSAKTRNGTLTEDGHTQPPCRALRLIADIITDTCIENMWTSGPAISQTGVWFAIVWLGAYTRVKPLTPTVFLDDMYRGFRHFFSVFYLIEDPSLLNVYAVEKKIDLERAD